MPELTTAPTETAVDPADLEYFVDVSETPDAINQITTQNRHNSFAASTTEALTGTSVAKHVTPDALAALWEQGSDIASAGTISVGEGGYHHVTGTTTITDIDFATDKAGRKVWLKFNGILTLTHHATTLILPTGANIVTAAGDIACFISEGSDNVRCVSYTRASGAALVGAGISGSVGATDNAVPRANGTGGATLQSSGVLITDTDIIQAPGIEGGGASLSIGGGVAGSAPWIGNFSLAKPAFAMSGTHYAQFTANQNDLALTSWVGNALRLSTDASRDLTGIVPANSGAEWFVLIFNVGANNLVLKHQSASSSANNRFINSTGADITLAANQVAELHYDPTDTRWRVFKKN